MSTFGTVHRQFWEYQDENSIYQQYRLWSDSNRGWPGTILVAKAISVPGGEKR